MENKVGKVGTKYKCISCNYIARDKFNYDKHLHTIKHYKLTNPEKIEIVEPTIYKCANCAKVYQHAPSLNKHKKKCIITPSINENILIEMIQTLTEEIKTMKAANITNNITNNNNNNNIHINIIQYLNTECKDAMNIMDFANSIIPTIEQTYDTIKMGITKGISQIFVNNLERLPKIQRPIWCADKKRKKLHIMNDNKWSEDTNNTLFETAIKRPVKNMIKIFNESFTHPITNDREIEKWKVGINKLTSDIEKDKVIDNINNIIHYPQ
jgi:DNA-directed RNA polymerase subunit RPC12/RpoP